MNELSELQDQLQAYLFRGNEEIRKNVVGTERVSLETRLEIYKNAYRLRLIDALAANFPVLKKYLGDAAFAELAEEYFSLYPSHYRSIRWFGDQLAGYLTAHATYQNYFYLVELAAFEWIMTLAFDAADAEPITLQAIGAIPPEVWETMRFKMHPAVYFLALKSNAAMIWQAMSQDEAPPDPEENELPIIWIFWREEFITRFCSLPADEAWAIQAMANGVMFGDICEGLCQWIEEEKAALHAVSLLKGWVNAGLIVQVMQ